MEPKEYTMGFRVTMEEIEDTPALEMMKQLEKRASEARLALAARLWNDEPYSPQIGRFRRWLGWILWRWAGRVNPETIDG